MGTRTYYGVVTTGGVLGLIASFLQMLEKIQLLKYQDKALACDINSVFSCTNVLDAWQSSVFGFPNALMCMVLFSIFASVALVGAAGGKVPLGVRLGVQALSLFTLLFGLWFLWQSTFVIGALCVFCIFCFAGLIAVNWGWLRLNATDLPIGEQGRVALQRGIASGVDTFVWILLAIVVAFTMSLHFI